MNSQRGMSLIEMLISLAIALICISAITSAISTFNIQTVEETRKIAARSLLAQQVSLIVSRPEEFPPYQLDGAEGSYVLCFNNQLAQIDYSATSTVKFVKTSDLGTATTTTQQCADANYEVRVRPESNAVGGIRWHISVTMFDVIQHTIIQKAETSFANQLGI